MSDIESDSDSGAEEMIAEAEIASEEEEIASETPVVSSDIAEESKPLDEPVTEFSELGLDDRLLKAIAKLGWKKPTMIQSYVVKHALAGKDILARARTGSGKTGAYAIPMLHTIMTVKVREANKANISCLVLVPTKELARQSLRNLKDIAKYCSRDISVVDLSGDGSIKNKKSVLQEHPDIVIGTPGKIVAHIEAGNMDLSTSLKMLVVDEADLVFSYGYEEDVMKLLSKLPPIRQNMLMSATLGSEVEALKKLVLRRPVVLKLEESDLPNEQQLLQHTIKCFPDDRFLITYAMLKLRLLRGKTIIFINETNQCYRLKLFLEQFSIKTCVLNSELPIQSRQHIVSQFNKGVYDYVIASDEAMSKSKKSKSKKDNEYGVARGVDFKDVQNVLNFDFPVSAKSYVHRVGRTARGHEAGVALSLISKTADEKVLEEVTELLKGDVNDESPLKPYAFKMSAIEGFRYRVRDALKGVTKNAIKEARRKEIRQEILNSELLKQHFEENPRDAEVLRHDAGLTNARRIKSHLKHVPDYLIPKGTEAARGRKRKDVSKYVNANALKTKRRKQNNPLKSFGGSKKK